MQVQVRPKYQVFQIQVQANKNRPNKSTFQLNRSPGRHGVNK